MCIESPKRQLLKQMSHLPLISLKSRCFQRRTFLDKFKRKTKHLNKASLKMCLLLVSSVCFQIKIYKCSSLPILWIQILITLKISIFLACFTMFKKSLKKQTYQCFRLLTRKTESPNMSFLKEKEWGQSILGKKARNLNW